MIILRTIGLCLPFCLMITSCATPQTKADVQVQIYYETPPNITQSPDDLLLGTFKVFDALSDTFFFVPEVILHRTTNTKSFSVSAEMSGLGKMRESFGVAPKQTDYEEAINTVLANFETPEFLSLNDNEEVHTNLPTAPYYKVVLKGKCKTSQPAEVLQCFNNIESFKNDYESILELAISDAADTGSSEIIILVTQESSTESQIAEPLPSDPNKEAPALETESTKNKKNVTTKSPNAQKSKGTGIRALKLTLSGGNYDKNKKVHRAAEKICWNTITGADKVKLKFTSDDGRSIPEKKVNAQNDCYDLTNLGVGTTFAVFSVEIKTFDKEGKLIGRGNQRNFQVSCK